MITISPALAFLQQRPHWVCFEPSKKPIDPNTDYGAKAGVPSTWSTYQAARLAVQQSGGRLVGIGRELLAEEDIVVADLDHSRIDGVIQDWAWEEIRRWNSYTEVSPSGTGIHIWARAHIPGNLPQDASDPYKFELYHHDKYLTWTGNHVEGTPDTIEDRYDVALARYWEVKATREARKSRSNGHTSAPLQQEEGRKAVGPAYIQKVLQDECTLVRAAAQGTRNGQLFRSACNLGELIGAGVLERQHAERELQLAGLASGLLSSEVHKTMRSGIERGMENPRQWVELVPQEDTPTFASSSNGNGHHTPPPEEQDVTDEDLCAFTADDAGNGDALYALYGQDFLWCGSIGWLTYCGTHWRDDEEEARVRQCAVETLRRRRHTAVEREEEAIIRCTKGDDGRVRGCLNRFKTLVNRSITDFDTYPDLLNCKNGVVDLRTGLLTPHSPQQFFTYCVQVDYEETDFSEWMTYLEAIVGGGREVIDYLQMAAGYSFTGHTREEVMFYLHGPTRSGKGSWAETYMNLLPEPLSTGVDFISFTARREGDVSNFDLAPLKPCRMLFASESNRGQALNPAKIKQLTGGDKIRACFKHKNFFSYRPQFKAWLLSNWPVNGDPDDDALWGRVRVITFPNSFLNNEDKTKKERLKQPDIQKSILYWTVQGAIKWYQLGSRGLVAPEYIVQTTQAHRDELDYVQQWLDEKCECDRESWTSNESVNASYTTWCSENNVQHAKENKGLTQSLKAKGYTIDQQKKVNGKNRKGVMGLYIPPTLGG